MSGSTHPVFGPDPLGACKHTAAAVVAACTCTTSKVLFIPACDASCADALMACACKYVFSLNFWPHQEVSTCGF